MAAKLLLCVSNDQATAALWRRRRVVSCARFENTEAGWTAFDGFLRNAQGLPVHIIVDTVEEDFRFETLPHIRGRDRTEMVGRKLKQLYRATPYASFALQDRETGKRRDDRYLFAALTNPDLLVPWLKVIEAHGMPVSGIFPLALVSASLIERLKLKHPNLLIVSKNSAGLRQTFFKDLKFRISRLTPLRADAEMADQHYADEIGNTRMYLDALTVTHVDDTLELVILDLDGSLSGLPPAIMRGRPNVQCVYLNLADIHKQVGIRIADLQVSPDVLHLHLLGEQTPTVNFAPPHLRRTFQRYAAGRWVYAASGAAVLGAVIWSGVNVYRAVSIDQDTVIAQQKTTEYQSKYQQVTAQFPDAPTSADNLRHTVEIAEQIRAGLRTPQPMLTLISRALDASPGIQLQRIEWHYGETLPARLGVKQTTGGETGRLQRGVVYGAVPNFAGDYRAAINAIDGFAKSVAENSAVAEVRALKLPLDVSPEAGLTGSTELLSGNEAARFELLVILRKGA